MFLDIFEFGKEKKKIVQENLFEKIWSEILGKMALLVYETFKKKCKKVMTQKSKKLEGTIC